MSLIVIIVYTVYWAQSASHVRDDQPRVKWSGITRLTLEFKEDWNEATSRDVTVGSKDNDDSESSTKKTTTGKNINEHTGNELLLMIFCMLQNFWGENLVYYIISMLVYLYWSSTRS